MKEFELNAETGRTGAITQTEIIKETADYLLRDHENKMDGVQFVLNHVKEISLDGYWTKHDGGGGTTHWDPETGQQIIKATAVGVAAVGTGVLIWHIIEAAGAVAAF